MSKSSFDVAIHEKKTVIFGVTSIFPNLNGVLLQTENRRDFQIENYEMGCNLSIEYYDSTMELPEGYTINDCRAGH